MSNVNGNASIGLDSMACVSAVSPSLFENLCAFQNVSFVKRPVTTVNEAAGGTISIDTYVNLVVQLSVGAMKEGTPLAHHPDLSL
jgi:hypothetical protein